MKFIISGPLSDNIYNLAKKIGYQFGRVTKNADGNDEADFSRIMSASGYPKFHLYVKSKGNDIVFNLHLDQKRPSYKGTSAHAGEYEGPTVEAELKRIKMIIDPQLQ
jgi:hypothetical protein